MSDEKHAMALSDAHADGLAEGYAYAESEINRLRAENEKLRARTVLIPETVWKMVDDYPALRAENENLRAALKPFSAIAAYCYDMGDHEDVNVSVEDIRAAAAALKGME